MRADMEKLDSLPDATNSDLTRRFRVVIADASPNVMSVVLSVLEFHEVVDLIGRAATVEEVVQLVLHQQPDLVLIDLEMRLSRLAIPAIVLASRNPVKIIGICDGEFMSLISTEILRTVDALIHKECLREEFLTLLRAYFRSTADFVSISSPLGPEEATDQWWSGLSPQIVN